MMLARPGWPAFVKTFHIAAIFSSAISSPITPAIGLPPAEVV